jgi:hypothetical protein
MEPLAMGKIIFSAFFNIASSEDQDNLFTGVLLARTGTDHRLLCPHPTYSPDLAPCDFYVFPKMKLRLKG